MTKGEGKALLQKVETLSMELLQLRVEHDAAMKRLILLENQIRPRAFCDNEILSRRIDYVEEQIRALYILKTEEISIQIGGAMCDTR